MSELSQYDYELPTDLIAQTPMTRRSDARMLVADRASGSINHHHVRDLPSILRPGDCLVLNDTKVVPARLVGYRTQTGGQWEGLFLETTPEGLWRVMSKTRGKLTAGETVTLVDRQGLDDVRLHLGVKGPEGGWIVRPETDERPLDLLDRVGRVPLPPYIRKGQMTEIDRNTYQTVYAESPGAVAAPTAGLHFTEKLLAEVEEAGVSVCRLTLHVGLGTFQPMQSEVLAEHEMHSEWGQIEANAVEQLAACRARSGRIVAVGTTSVRVLETAAADGDLQPFCGHTDLFIRPPYKFQAVDALMTNFHLPRTTLLVLVRTLGGDDLIRRAYDEAIRGRYRFYSYGDSMLIL